MVCVDHKEINMQEIHHKVENQPTVSLETLIKSKSGQSFQHEITPFVEIDHVYVDEYCTYFELSVNLGPSWWRAGKISCMAEESESMDHMHSNCGWTVHRRFVHNFMNFVCVLMDED